MHPNSMEKGDSMKNTAEHMGFNDWFGKLAARISSWVGSPPAFVLAITLVVLWALLGPHYQYSDTWQLVINTGTTVVTFLIVFLIQNTQNRDARALHLKLDELIRGVHGARTGLVGHEELSDQELDDLQQQFDRIRQRKSATVSVAPHE